MKVASLAAIALIGMACANPTSLPRREVTKSAFGAMEITDWHDHGMVKTVYHPQKEFKRDYERQATGLKRAAKQIKVNQDRLKTDKLYKCDNRVQGLDPEDDFYFVPVSVGSVNSAHSQVTYNGTCF
jgi:hypothetical protein